MKLDDIFTITPDSYRTYYIKPDYNVSNRDNVSIANALTYMFKPLTSRMKINLKETKIEFTKQAYFTIILKHKSAEFYFTMPESHNDMIYSKIRTIWKGSEIREQSTKPISESACVGELLLNDYAFKSLQCTTNNLYPLTNMMGIIKSLKEDEEVRITVCLEPFGRQNWMYLCDEQLKPYKLGIDKTIKKSTQEKVIDTAIKCVDAGVDIYLEWNEFLLDSAFSIILDDKPSKKKKEDKKEISNNQVRTIQELSEFTRYKLHSEVFKAKIYIAASGPSTEANKLNVMSAANSYRDLEADNTLVLNMLNPKQSIKAIQSINKRLVKVDKKCILSDKEVAKIIQLPQKDLQNEYELARIDTREVDIPDKLQNGKVRIGMAMKVGKDFLATFAEDINIMALAKVIVGPQNAGKTTTLKRIVKDFYKAGHSNVVIDVIEDCEVAKEVAEVVHTKDKVIIRIGNRNHIPSLAYTEVSRLIKEDMDVWERVRLADLIAEQVEYLINAVITENTNDLTAPMLRYLHSSCMVTFIKPMATVGDLFKVLRDYKYRAEMVAYAKHSRCFRLDDSIFTDLAEIDKKNTKGTVIGTREDLIIGITNRVTMLQKNRYIKEMLEANIDTEEDFGKYIDEGKSIFVEIPQNMFPNTNTRDLLATYFVTRLWLTVQLRKDNKHARLCNLVFDEVGIIENTCRFISNHVTEFRRHRLGTIFTCHYLKQFKGLLTALKSSGASYILLAGTEKENLELLKEELEPFTIEEGLHLKEHTSLNIINYGSQYAKFITKQMKE